MNALARHLRLWRKHRLAWQRTVVIGLLLLPASAAVALTMAHSVPANVQPTKGVDVPSAHGSTTTETLDTPARATVTSTETGDQTTPGTAIEFSAQQTSPTEPLQANLRINGLPVMVPTDATVHKVIQHDGSTTVLDISHSSSNSQDSAQSQTTINVNASSEAVHSSEGP